jgi:hypothetical protein
MARRLNILNFPPCAQQAMKIGTSSIWFDNTISNSRPDAH